MAITVVLEDVKPGIALGPSEATKLKGQIAARLESAKPGKDTAVTFPDFKGTDKRRVVWSLIREDGETAYVRLSEFTRIS